jgi:iron complex outermembrane recepter protein
MTIKLAAETPRLPRTNITRWLISAAVATAIWGTAAPQRAVAQDQTPSASDQSAPLAEVTVTGSRIARSRDMTAPSPITTVSSDAFQNTGATGAESVLNKMPQFVPSQSQFTSGDQSSPTSSPGQALVNLRGLGTNRNLVLVDGRRPQPGNGNLAVDLNTIPTLAIKSVEIISGGASAVYGPDAIAGVVNYVLKDDFQGLDVDVQRSQTQHGGGAETKISALMGMNGMDGKGNVMLGIEFNRRDPVFASSRSFYPNGWNDPTNPSGGFLNAPGYAPTTGNQPAQAVLNGLFPQLPPGKVGPGTQIDFNADGTPFIQAGGVGYNGPLLSPGTGRYSQVKLDTNGQLDQFYTGGWVSTPLQRHSFYGRGTFQFTDNISGYAEFNYSNIDAPSMAAGYAPAITIWGASIPRYNTAGGPQDSSWLPPALVTLLNSRPVNPNAPAGTCTGPNCNWTLYENTNYEGPITVDASTDVWQGTVGLKGKLPFKDWSWDVYASRGNTHIQDDYNGLPSLQRYQYLVSLPNFGVGANVKAPPGTPAGYGVSCPTGLPVFQQFTPDPTCLDSINDLMKSEENIRQNIIEGTLQGAAFPLPAGDLRFALGADYRGDDLTYTPGNVVGDIADNPVGLFPSNNTRGSTNVKEIYTELLVPVVHRLDLDLGYRWSDFNTAGGTNTWMAMVTWKPIDSVSFRGGFQAATRAPNVAELYTGPTQQVVSFPQEDPCSSSTLSPWGNVASNPNRAKVQALCEALIGNMTSEYNTQTFNTPNGPDGWTRQSPKFFPLEIEQDTGNPKVKPETGRTYTIGTVISEPFGISHLTATFDYYHINISDTIAPESSIPVYNACFNSNGTSNPTYDVTNANCQLIHRDPITGDRAWVVSLFSNLGQLKTRGLDVNINWAHDLGPGTIALGTAINYLFEYEYQTTPTAPFVNAKGTLDPVQGIAGGGGLPAVGGLFEYTALSHVQYTWQNLTAGLEWQHKSSIHAAAYSTSPTSTIQGERSYDLFNLFSTYNFGNYSVRFGIENLLDKQPLIVGAQPGVDSNTDATAPALYDILGRRFYVGASARF